MARKLCNYFVSFLRVVQIGSEPKSSKGFVVKRSHMFVRSWQNIKVENFCRNPNRATRVGDIDDIVDSGFAGGSGENEIRLEN